MNQIKGYTLLLEQELTGIKSKGYLLRHDKSGARVVYIENEDDNKVFSIGFRTPPSDSTGVPHIMEHSVLCGSKNFPAKDPFVELVKGSLNTFLNAMTYPDKTVYPVASCNDKDFKNLMHVYLDAVFYPNIYVHDEIFRQEGWSYKLDSAEDKLKYNGVVYNEMKGAFSNPEGVLDRVVLNHLFPDTCYANESGGDPEVIPELTYENFIAFHQKFYHPSNSFIYLYGKMDIKERLTWMDEHYLNDFEKIEVDSQIELQKPFEQVKDIVTTYSIASEESLEDNTFLSYNKVVGTSLDSVMNMGFEVLDYALLSAPGAPLKKALIDAGIGKDVYGSYDDGIYQPIFSVVAKNANEEQKEAFVSIIENVLKEAVEKGVDQKALQAGINYMEFRYREADYGNYPKGLMYGLDMLDSWLYDENEPFMHIDALDHFEFLKEQIGTDYFETLIQKYILDNTHGAIVTVKPEQGRTARMDAELEKHLEDYKNSLSEEEIQHLVDRTKQLEAYQSEPETKENLEKIPVLKRTDISHDVAPVQNEAMKIMGLPVLYHEIETNGIGYLDVLFELSDISQEDLPYLGILQSVLGLIDTENFEYGTLFNEINLHTGGIGSSLELYNDVQAVREKKFIATFEWKAKALYEKLPVAFEMMAEILTQSKLTDTKRIKEILSMSTSRMLMRFQSAGHSTAVLRCNSYNSPTAKFKELTAGIDYFRVISDLEEHFDEKKDMLVQKLYALAKHVFNPGNMMVSYTASREGLEPLESVKVLAEALKKAYGEKKDDINFGKKPQLVLACEKKNEGFKTASKVQYVARTGNFIDRGLEYHGALHILRTILGYDYLWQNIRVKGGAYGCMCGFSRTGEGHLVSYRDPNLKRTIDVYEGVPQYLRAFDADERDMTKYIIGTMSGIDTPMNPAAKGTRALGLYLRNVKKEMMLEERAQLLDAQPSDIRALAPIVEAVLAAEQICVIGGEDVIEENKELFASVTSFS